MNLKNQVEQIQAHAERIRQAGKRLTALSEADLRTEKQPNGEWTAIDDNTYDGHGSAVGWGDTEDEAIDDLLEQLVERHG